MFREVLAQRRRRPILPAEGRPGLAHALSAAGARTILPDMPRFGASGKPRETEAYADSAMARDALARDPPTAPRLGRGVGFSMGCGTATRLLMRATTPGEVRHSGRRWRLCHLTKSRWTFQKLADSGFCAATYHRPGMGPGGSKDSGTGRNRFRTPHLRSCYRPSLPARIPSSLRR
jgi:hypothetical protein